MLDFLSCAFAALNGGLAVYWYKRDVAWLAAWNTATAIFCALTALLA